MSNKKIKLVVMRHAESLEDIDDTAYERLSDAEMPLSEKGQGQSSSFGKNFGAEYGHIKNFRFVLSPSKRALETAEGIACELPPGANFSFTTEQRIAKQDWGDVTVHNRKAAENERRKAGILNYAFPNGESGREVLVRFADFAAYINSEIRTSPEDELFVVITHGLEIQFFLKAFFNWTDEYFETLPRIKNCGAKKIGIGKDGLPALVDEL